MRKAALLALLLLAGCASAPPPKPALPATSPIQQALVAQYRQWQGVPYRLGGTSKTGIDCSAFTRQTFKQRFSITLPRTTAAQVRLGKPVAQQHLRPGDLVFFKTGRRSRHVGIYQGNGLFLHASTSVGVTVSALDNPYWQAHYWTARRIFTR
ncbi:NlpC/P60 family protein [Gallaecimonas sp. GXIMD1310]|uniref:NlpC/P60 family protein n=1 Tax=Gallaecimonas sp. GXIMD1310 TaxID=3131926 RepID=UPI003255B0C3